jgi:hypothetical protein
LFESLFPTVKSLEKLNFVVSPEDKTNTQLGNAVINDIRELVDQTKNSAFFSFVLSLFSLFYSRECFGITTATFPVFGIRAFLSFLFIVFPTLLNFVVSPEDKTNTQLGNAVINDIRELVDQTKNSRSDCARTTLSVIAASTSGLNVQKEHKKAGHDSYSLLRGCWECLLH